MFPETASQCSLTALNELQVIFLHARAGKGGTLLIALAPRSDRHQMRLLRKLPHSHIRLSSAKSLSSFFSVAKVCFAYYTLPALS
jgi:hypothetical protein